MNKAHFVLATLLLAAPAALRAAETAPMNPEVDRIY